jgi:hypothetical protein
MPNDELSKFALTCHQFLAGLISAWFEEFLAAGILVIPMILVIVARRMKS